jgi:hypothetical protein
LFAASFRVQSRLWLVTQDCAGILLVRIKSAASLVWFLFSYTAAAQLLANSCSPLRCGLTTGRRSARGISVRLTSCSRSPAFGLNNKRGNELGVSERGSCARRGDTSPESPIRSRATSFQTFKIGPSPITNQITYGKAFRGGAPCGAPETN